MSKIRPRHYTCSMCGYDHTDHSDNTEDICYDCRIKRKPLSPPELKIKADSVEKKREAMTSLSDLLWDRQNAKVVQILRHQHPHAFEPDKALVSTILIREAFRMGVMSCINGQMTGEIGLVEHQKPEEKDADS